MRKKLLRAAAAVCCAVYALISCSGPLRKKEQERSQPDRSFSAGADWYGDDESLLRLFSDGTGTLSGISLRWAGKDGGIECLLLPGYSIGRTIELRRVSDEGFPALESGEIRYHIRKKQPAITAGSEDESEEAPAEATVEELIAQEGLEAANLCFGFIGWDYMYGGKSPDTGFDCSGLAYYVFEQLGYRLERVANAQSKQGVLIDKENAQPGDLLCFGAPDYCHHVGIYVGQGYYIHAMGSEYGVVATSLDDPYLKRPKYEVRRIVGCDWLKIENIEAALAAGLPTLTPSVEGSDELT